MCQCCLSAEEKKSFIRRFNNIFYIRVLAKKKKCYCCCCCVVVVFSLLKKKCFFFLFFWGFFFFPIETEILFLITDGRNYQSTLPREILCNRPRIDRPIRSLASVNSSLFNGAFLRYRYIFLTSIFISL